MPAQPLTLPDASRGAASRALAASKQAGPRSGRPFRQRRAGQYLLLAVVVFGMAAPLLWMILTSVKPDLEIIGYPPTILPAAITGRNYETLFAISEFATYLRNSLVVSGAATVTTLLAGLTAAYALSRFRFRFLQGIGEIALFAYMIPPILLLVPIAQIITRLGLANNLTALVILYTATLLPFALWVLRSYFNGVAIEIEQAAMVDGATRARAFRDVIVPQALPGVISTGIFTFNAAWSEYLFASTLMTSPSRTTLSPGLALLLSQTGVYSWGVLMAASVIVVVPVIILFIVVQRQLVTGLGEGAVKG